MPSERRSPEIDKFLRRVVAAPRRGPGHRGRLIFAMDATASREPSWDRACRIQGEMFLATDALGGLEVQLVFYRGFGECKASPWVTNSRDLVHRMTAVRCLGGQTQIRRVLAHAIEETRKRRVNALVFVGDCMEEDVDALSALAGELGLLGVPAFIFHEGADPVAARGFRQIAKLTKGAYCAFDASSADQLRELLSAVAVYAAGGRRALEDLSRARGGMVRLLTNEMK
ncbi:MAG TPA: VWA domain-containing protein [Alphaproteobacteria bacterium]